MEQNKNGISASIIADSLNQHGQRLTTFVLVFPRIVLAEFNTHRMLSRNSASSRAIPFEKMLKMVQENPFIPLKWMKDHKGMQGTEYFDKDSHESIIAKETWFEGRKFAVATASQLSKLGITKQFCNRLLEPFMWHTAIVTATEWDNFFALRAEDGAEIHIQELAYQMLDVYNKSTPNQLKAGECHIPFGDKIDAGRLGSIVGSLNIKDDNSFVPSLSKVKVMVATARCARVSYLNFEGKDDYEADIKLHDSLLKSGHMSPFEHCAQAMSKIQYEQDHIKCEIAPDGFKKEYGWSGNFKGFIQYRKTITGENKIDNRIKK